MSLHLMLSFLDVNTTCDHILILGDVEGDQGSNYLQEYCVFPYSG